MKNLRVGANDSKKSGYEVEDRWGSDTRCYRLALSNRTFHDDEML